MTGSLIPIAILSPFLCAAVLPLIHACPRVQEAAMLAMGTLVCCAVAGIVLVTLSAGHLEHEIFSVTPLLKIGFEAEPAGITFACVASVLWVVNAIYAIGYMDAIGGQRRTLFHVCFAVVCGSVMMVAFAGNLFTLFLGYEILTLSTYPLVTYTMNVQAKKAGRIYLLVLLSTSMLLFFPAIMWTANVAGTLDFTVGGILDGKMTTAEGTALLALFLFGIGKAAIMPGHVWLPVAMVAPTPVSALLHAVAVVKTGVFVVMKVVIYVFGIEFLGRMDGKVVLIWVAVASLLLGSCIAMTKSDLKARLAYSTVSQLAYIVLASLLATELSLVGGAMHIVAHAFGKITLFFCVGAIYVTTKKTSVEDINGLGRTMPLTFVGFLVGALSVVGLPPTVGMWSKWYMTLGVVESGYLAILGVLMLSSMLSTLYLVSIPFRAFFLRGTVGTTGDGGGLFQEAPVPCLLAIALSCTGCILLFFFPEMISGFLDRVEIR